VGIDAIDLTGSSDDEAGPSSRPGLNETRRADAISAIGAERGERVKREHVPDRSNSSAAISESIDTPIPTRSTLVSKSSQAPIPVIPSKPPAARKPKAAKINRPPEPTQWACPTCTLLNPTHHLSCDACSTERPMSIYPENHDGSIPRLGGNGPTGVYGVGGTQGTGLGTTAGWYCGMCGEGPTSWERWSCEECGVVRNFG
jgi:hypothetical protein